MFAVNLLDKVSAQSFFNDNTLNLGDWSSYISNDNVLDLVFNLNITTNDAGSRFYTEFLIGNSTLNSGAATAPVPVPTAGWLFLSALGAMVGTSRRRKSHPRSL